MFFKPWKGCLKHPGNESISWRSSENHRLLTCLKKEDMTGYVTSQEGKRLKNWLLKVKVTESLFDSGLRLSNEVSDMTTDEVWLNRSPFENPQRSLIERSSPPPHPHRKIIPQRPVVSSHPGKFVESLRKFPPDWCKNCLLRQHQPEVQRSFESQLAPSVNLRYHGTLLCKTSLGT